MIKMNTKIYKYLPMNLNTIRLLVTGHLYLVSPSRLNDPFESEFEFEKIDNIPDIDFLKKIFTNKKIDVDKINQNNFYEHLKELLKDILDEEYGITCFSEVNDDILMWSYYANSHKGICLEFDIDKLSKSEVIRIFDLKLENIKTLNEVPKVEIIINEDGFTFKEKENIALWKFPHWSHEKEIRLHGNLSNYRNINGEIKRTIPFDSESLTGIYLGEKISEEDKNLLAHLINNHKELQHIKWYHVKKDLMQSNMKIEHFGGYGIIKSIKIDK